MTRRFENRSFDVIRPFSIEKNTFGYATGGVLISMGQTKVLCSATIIDGVPRFLKDQGQGWLTAEYMMLPNATHTRSDRESIKGKQQSRSIEIQRLIGRALRQAIDLNKIGERTIQIDCDVLQADGGTRVASINGGMVALMLAIRHLQYEKLLKHDPIRSIVTAISLGKSGDDFLLDLDYEEDSSVDIDLNLVADATDGVIEIQGTAEKAPLTSSQLNAMVELGLSGIATVRGYQKEFLEIA